MVLTTPPIAAVSARQIADACGDDPGVLCRRVLESTHDRTLAAVADFVVGKPLVDPRDHRRGGDRQPARPAGDQARPAAARLRRPARAPRRGPAARPDVDARHGHGRGQRALDPARRGARDRAAQRRVVRDLDHRGVHGPRRGRDQPRAAHRRRRDHRRGARLRLAEPRARLPVGHLHPRRGPVRRRRHRRPRRGDRRRRGRQPAHDARALASTGPSGTSRTARSRASATSRSTGRARCSTSRSATGPTSRTRARSSSASPTRSGASARLGARGARAVGRRGARPARRRRSAS